MLKLQSTQHTTTAEIDTDKQHCNLQQQTEQNIELTLLL
jgi:hypothetical protein